MSLKVEIEHFLKYIVKKILEKFKLSETKFK